MLFEVLKLLKDFDANIVSVATSPHDDPGRKVFILRIETRNYKVLKPRSGSRGSIFFPPIDARQGTAGRPRHHRIDTGVTGKQDIEEVYR